MTTSLQLRRFSVLALVLATAALLAGCSGRTTGASDVTSSSALLTAAVSCGARESCRSYFEYWPAGTPRAFSLKTEPQGLPTGTAASFSLSASVTELRPNTTYRWVLCGSPNGGYHWVCVGPTGRGGSRTADPPPDFATFTTGEAQGPLAETWNGVSWVRRNVKVPAGSDDGKLGGISCTSANECIAVGSSSDNATAPLAERWNGESWKILPTSIPSGAQTAELTDVSCTSATACIAVGSYFNGANIEMPLAERWNGVSWQILPSPIPPGAQSGRLEGISCTAPEECTAVGGSEETAFRSRPLVERWNGTSWVIQQTPELSGGGGLGSLQAVSCSDATACTAVGRHLDENGFWLTLAESWRGAAWSVIPTPNLADVRDAHLNAISCTSASECTAVGNSTDNSGGLSLLGEHFDGTDWTILPIPRVPNLDAFLNAISCSAPATCTAVGQTRAGGSDPQTVALRSDNAGWVVQATPRSIGRRFNRSLNAVSCPTATVCHAVGHN